MIHVHTIPVNCHFCGKWVHVDDEPVLMQGSAGLVACCLEHLFIISDEFRIRKPDYEEKVRELYAEAMYPKN